MNAGKACRTYWFYVSIWPLWMLVLPSSFSAWNNPLKRLAKANREQNNKNALTLFPERGRCEVSVKSECQRLQSSNWTPGIREKSFWLTVTTIQPAAIALAAMRQS